MPAAFLQSKGVHMWMCENKTAGLPVIIPKILNMSDNPTIYVCAVHVPGQK